MIGIISSRLLGMLSPGFRYRLTSTNSKILASFSSDVEVTEDRTPPAQTRMGDLLFATSAVGASLGNGAPMLMTPLSSADAGSVAD